MNSIGKTKCGNCNIYLRDINYEDHIFHCYSQESGISSNKYFLKSNVSAQNNRKNNIENRHKKCDICHIFIESNLYDDHIYGHSLEESKKNRGSLINFIPNIFDDIQINRDLIVKGKNNSLNFSTILNGSIFEDIISPIQTPKISKKIFNEDFNQTYYEQNRSSVSKRSNMNQIDNKDISIFIKNKPKQIYSRRNDRNSNFYSYEELLKLDENNIKKSLNNKLIDELPCETITKSILRNLSSEDKKCSICFDDFVQGDRFIRLPCFHIFHEKEIKQWFEANKTCPICKIDIEEVLK